jgi:diguanylate cyclase (GGDEF)-like protein/PAS domain S-box-containing protein
VLIEHLRDAVLFVRKDDGRIIKANSAAAELYGYDLDELTAMTIFDLVHTPEGQPRPVDATRDGLITEEGVMFEGEHVCADGRIVHVEANARLVNLNGHGPEVLAIVRDVSDRVSVRHQVQEAHDELDQVFNTAADGMRVIDANYNVIRANQTLADMAGIDLKSIIGTKCYDSYGGEDCGTDRCAVKRIMSGDVPEVKEIRKNRGDGTWMDAVLTARPFIRNERVVGVVEDFQDITDRKRAEERAHFLATHDPLTWLPNRLLFHDRLSIAIAAAERGHGVPGLIFFDIDDFKGVNDCFGHAAGDEVLCCISEILQGALRKGDTAARLGGDEFVVLLPNADDRPKLDAVAEKLLETAKTCVRRQDGDVAVTVSMGGTMYVQGDSDDTFMQRADEAMYAAKFAGGNRYVFHSG